MAPMETVHLLQRCRAGEAEAVRDLLLQYEPRLFRLALSILEDPAEAGEVTQDAFLAALRGLDSYRGKAALDAWLAGITVNLCRKQLRRRRSTERLSRTLQSLFRIKRLEQEPAEEAAIRNETRRSLLKALMNLDEKHRLPLILYYYNDFSTAEIAGMLKIPVGTVLSRISTAKERLRAALSERNSCTLDKKP